MSAYAWAKLKQAYSSDLFEEFEVYLVPSSQGNFDNEITPDSPMFIACIKALANGEDSFKINVVDSARRIKSESFCEISDYKIYDREFVNQYKAKPIIDLTEAEATPIYICGRSKICYRHRHNVTTVNAKVFNRKKTRVVDITVSKCSDKAHFDIPHLFIFIEELKLYEKRFGTLLFKHLPDSSLNDSGSQFERSKYHKMALNGYSVAKNSGLTEADRHELLIYFIENNIVSYIEMAEHFDFLIFQARNNPYQQDAISEWQKDWSFIKKYVSEKGEYKGYLSK